MSFGAGRPASKPSIDGVRELTSEDIATYVPGRATTLKNIKDSHHMLARMFAIGLRPGEVAKRTGYSPTRLSVLRSDPAFIELVEQYKASVDTTWEENVDEYFELMAQNRIKTARLINEKLEEAEDDIDKVSFRDLVSIHSDAADRTGYPKRSVAVNVNVDFAAKLDAAIKRTNAAQGQAKVIDITPSLKRRA